MPFCDNLVQTLETIYWCHLANTVDRSVRGGNAVLRRFTVSDYSLSRCYDLSIYGCEEAELADAV